MHFSHKWSCIEFYFDLTIHFVWNVYKLSVNDSFKILYFIDTYLIQYIDNNQKSVSRLKSIKTYP